MAKIKNIDIVEAIINDVKYGHKHLIGGYFFEDMKDSLSCALLWDELSEYPLTALSQKCPNLVDWLNNLQERNPKNWKKILYQYLVLTKA